MLFSLTVAATVTGPVLVDAATTPTTLHRYTDDDDAATAPAVVCTGKDSTTSGTVIDFQAVRAFLARILHPSAAAAFELMSYDCSHSAGGGDDDDRDSFELRSGATPGTISVRGTSASALTAGIGWYLKYGANATVEWEDGAAVPAGLASLRPPLPDIPPELRGRRVQSPVRWRYYFNVCTLGYTTAFWQFRRWERELDWMALRGINLPLAYVGQELIWERVFVRAGLNASQLDDFFSGPAFLPWQRMGNMRRFGGPLPTSWKEKTATLQKRLLRRMRELGMTPVLPGFSGFVPYALEGLGAKLLKSPNWGGFPREDCCVGLLDASDPMFAKLGQWTIEELRSAWGVDGVYGADTFNEMSPPSLDPNELRKWGSAVYNGIQAGDPDGTWMLQGWLFHNQRNLWTNDRIDAYLSGAERTLVLDLFTDVSPAWDRSKEFAGRPWVWNMLQNFGGRRDLQGNLTRVATGPVQDMASSQHMVGIGATPEAIENNLVMFDLLYEMGWRAEAPDVGDWVQRYATRRYGWPLHESAVEAWEVLRRDVYVAYRPYHSPIESKPTLNSVTVPENYLAFRKAWRLLADAAEANQTANGEAALLYDLVDVGRQVLVNHFGSLHAALRQASHKCPKTLAYCLVVRDARDEMLEVIADLDDLMASNGNFLLGRWIASAVSWAGNDDEADLYAYNAKNQVTWWGPDQNIRDYASKPWAGLLGTYYKPRWEAFLSVIIDAAKDRTQPDLTVASKRATDAERAWLEDASLKFSTDPIGDTVAITKKLLKKYGGAGEDRRSPVVDAGFADSGDEIA